MVARGGCGGGGGYGDEVGGSGLTVLAMFSFFSFAFSFLFLSFSFFFFLFLSFHFPFLSISFSSSDIPSTRMGDDRPIRAYNENVGIHGEVFAISAANVQAHGACFASLEKTFDDGPWLCGRRKEKKKQMFVINLRWEVFENVLLSLYVPCSGSRRSERRFVRRRRGRALLRSFAPRACLVLLFLVLTCCFLFEA